MSLSDLEAPSTPQEHETREQGWCPCSISPQVPSGIGRDCGAVLGAFDLRWGSVFGSSPHMVLTAVLQTKNKPGIVTLGVSSQHHQALSSEASVRLGGEGLPHPSQNSIKMALLWG